MPKFRLIVIGSIFIFLVSKGVSGTGLFIYVIFAWLWANGRDQQEKDRIAQEELEKIAKIERQNAKIAKREQERILEIERIEKRDANNQNSPYQYECKGHPNATLAIRYGIANLQADNKFAGEEKFY